MAKAAKRMKVSPNFCRTLSYLERECQIPRYPNSLIGLGGKAIRSTKPAVRLFARYSRKSLALIFSMVPVNKWAPLKMSVSSAKKQKMSRAMK